MPAIVSSLGRRLRDPRLAPLWIAVAVWAALAAGGATDTGRHLERRGFDLLTRLTAPGASRLPITIVGIDEASFAQIGRQWPWDRDLHATLVERLTAAGAAVVAFDVLFSEPSDPVADARFAEAIRAAGTVVLASDMVFQETSYVRQWLRVDPIDLLRDAGARRGLAGVTLDPDAVVRRLPLYADALWREILLRFEENRPGLIPPPAEPPPGALIRYLGPDHTFPYVSYYQALDPGAFLPEGFFQDQIVIVGREVRASPEVGAAQADSFSTPFTAATSWLTPGVEIHATILENAVLGRAVRPLPRSLELLLLTTTVLLCLLAMGRWRPLRAAAAGLAVLAAVALAVRWLFGSHDLWLPAVSSMLSPVALYVGLGGWEYLKERRQRQTLKTAFGHYLPRAVMEEILAHPELLALGGQRREITLLFTDLAGFTSLAEHLSPEQVAQLLNRHLTQMTGIIMRAGGTVDKFIGDSIMAFWGAPLADPAQADRACAAALEMQRSLGALRAELASQGLPGLWMRIGINSGPAVVGNLGSQDRFDYTAIGDNVNLASRLEGVNKLYGTGILLSQATAAQLTAAVAALRPVDKVRVKGKSLPVEIFTLCERPELCEATREAIAAYRAREWDRAEKLWRAVQALEPDDVIARLFLARIGEFEKRPPPPEWDGATALDKM